MCKVCFKSHNVRSETTWECTECKVALHLPKMLSKTSVSAKRITEENKRLYQLEQDRKIKIKSLHQENDLVLLHNESKTYKLDKEWLGPYKVIDVQIPNYLSEISSSKNLLVHGNRLKPFYCSRNSS
ncbi:hypothetical protein K0M31_002635 [Melipona bicolor]|uniref:Uncharacterized protein n=1 Tax=Melipona bicolor TaxID=60889 RepID=A0AA40KYP7_9HYME|nr:hypothetical protein K0M31_002635 [Melipona bicolor]